MKEAEIRPAKLFNEYLALAKQDAARFFGSGRRTSVPCPACGEKRGRPAFKKLGFQYALCPACGSLYVSPRPAPERFAAFYRDGRSVKFWASDFFKKTAEARREKMFRPRAKLLKSLAPRGGDFIDIGSGYGIFLEEVRRLGLFQSVRGIEPAPALAQVCRQKGFAVVEAPIETAAGVAADWMTAFEVLEHVYAPLDFLTAARRLLKKDGRLLFTTLACTGFDIQTLWERSKSAHPPHHVNLMSLAGLRRLVTRAGLALEDLSTPGELDLDIVAGALAEDPKLPVPRFVRALVHAPEPARRAFQEFLQRARLSSHVRVVARSA